MAICTQSGFGDSDQQKRILIIDDKQGTTVTLRIALEDKGFKIESYTSLLVAYENFIEGLYDLVILDIKMPVVDGFHLYKKIKAIDSRVKLIFFTASEFYYEQFRKEYGFDVFKQEFFLRKPIGTKDLVQTINKLSKLNR